MFPTEITYTDFKSSPALNESIEKKAEKLHQINKNIQSCRVVISSPHRHHKQKVFHVQIQLGLPHAELVVNRETEKDLQHTDAYLAVRDAFKCITRQLVQLMEKKSQHHHHHAGTA